MPIFLLLSAFTLKDNTVQVAQLLTSGTWYQNAYYADLDGDGVITESSLPCQVGDGWKFNADFTFELRDELPNCDSDVDAVTTITGRWELRNNDTELYVEIDPDFLYYNFKIQMINGNQLVLKLLNDPGTQAPPEERFVLSR